MPDDKPSENIKEQPKEHSPAVQPVNPPPPPDKLEPPVTKPVTAEEVKAEVKIIEDRVKRAEKWVIGLTAAIAFLGLCQVIAGLLQWHVMSGQLEKMGESNTISREGLVSAQRAFVFFSPQTQQFYALDKEGSTKILSWRFEVPIKNSGTTPAKNLRDHVFVEALASPITKDFNFHDFESGESAAANPQDTIFYETQTISSGVLSRTKGATKHVYIYGWVTYNDVFEGTPQRVTKFCYEVHAVSGDFTTTIGTKETRTTLCGFHNCSDDDCKGEKAN